MKTITTLFLALTFLVSSLPQKAEAGILFTYGGYKEQKKLKVPSDNLIFGIVFIGVGGGCPYQIPYRNRYWYFITDPRNRWWSAQK